MSKITEILVSNHIPIAIGLLTIFVFLLYNFFLKSFKRDPRLVKFAKTLPGPVTLPLIGNGLDTYHWDTVNKFLRYSEKYGHTYRLWLGKHLLVVLTKAEDLEDVFMTSKMLGKAEISRPFLDFWGNGIFTGPLHIWKKNRKKFQPVFANNAMSAYTPVFDDKIYTYVELLKKLVDGEEFDAWDYMPYLSFDIITKTSLDFDSDRDEKSALQFHECVKTAIEICFAEIFRPWLHVKWIGDLFYKKLMDTARGNVLKFSQKVVNSKIHEIKEEVIRRKNAIISSKEGISLKSFLSIAYEIQEEANDEKLMHDEIITTVAGGTDTTAVMTSFFLLAIAIHQDIQAKLYDEIFEIFGDSDRHADHDDVKRMPYLDQVMKESLRRFTLTPIMLRDVEEDCKIGNRVFPAGTTLLISIAGIHYNPENYPDPMKFNPDNFSPKNIEKRHKLTFLSFGAGARDCIGKNYAMLEMKLTMIALLRHFSFHSTVKMEDIPMKMGFMITNPNGYKISIKTRIRKPSYL
uniref:Cytochrome P450 3634A4 n=1 Tax=Maconellicoccus hirsutus TaxID=177089 RepID=A0AAT9UTV5_MACHI